MNNEDMKKKDQYSKLLFNRLSEGRRQSLQIVEEAFSKESSAEETYEEVIETETINIAKVYKINGSIGMLVYLFTC